MSSSAVLKQETQPVAEDPENLSTEELQNLTDDVEIPYRVEDATLMSPGVWNDIRWLQDEIEDAFERTDFEDGEKHNRALFLDHEDRDAAKWIGQVENLRMDGEDLVGDLVITDKETAIKLEFGAKFGISPKVTGKTDGQVMKTFQFDNFSVVVDPAVKTTFLNSQIFDNDAIELQEMEIHEPEFDDTADQEWNSPDMEDFETDDMSEIDDHFIVSDTGFPPENFTDLALPVVEPDGTLNLNALANAKARAGQVEGVSGDREERVNDIINRLANENFEDADFGGGEMASHVDDEDMGAHEDEMEEHMSEDEDRASDEDENDVMGDKSTMSNEEEQEQNTPEEEQSVENEETTVDVEDLAQKVAEILEDDGDAEEDEVEEEEVEEEDVENSDVEAADFDDFQSFAEEKMAENPDLSITDVAEMYEESQRDVEDKMEEMAQRFEEKIDSLQDELEEKEETLSEVKEKAENPQRVTKTTGEDVKSVKEKVEELSDDQLDKAVMKNWMEDAGIRMVTDQ